MNRKQQQKQVKVAKKGASSEVKIQKQKKKKERRTKAQRFDVNRMTANPKSQIIVNGNSVPAINYVATINNNALRMFITGWLSSTMVRGGVARTDVPDYPAAFQYMGNILASAFSGQNYAAGNVPMWLRNITQAIQPKMVNLDLGEGSYSFSYSGSPPALTTPTIPIGATAWGYEFSYALPNDAAPAVNGFPVCTLFAPAPYTPQGGSTAFQKLAQLMADMHPGGVANKMSALVPSTEATTYLKDVSAFAICKPKQGYGSTSAGTDQLGGCFGHNTELEVPIHHPILACIGGGSDGSNRYGRFVTNFGGDPTFLSAFCSLVLHPAEMSMKRAPRFHQVDFLEFAETLALWVQGVQRSSSTEGSINTDLPSLQCPLTLQEVTILLRNVMMGAFKDTQPGVQGLGNLKPAVATDNYFAPFLCAPGTCPISPTPMLLPVPFVENIRALVHRKVLSGANKNNVSDITLYVPILGKFVADGLVWDDYTFEIPSPTGPPTVLTSFKDPSTVWVRRRSNSTSSKTSEEKMDVMVESPIDLIDGFSGSNYVAINDPNKLNELTMMWNSWITENAIASHSCKLTQFSTDLGISCLSSVNMTRHHNILAGLSSGAQIRQKDHFVEDIRLRKKQWQSVTASPYVDRFAILDTSSVQILDEPYAAVLGTWILPTNFVTFIGSSDQSTQVQRVATAEGEPFSVPLVVGERGQSLSEMHAKYAAKMVKGSFSQTTQWDDYFQKAELSGRGGILSSLVGGLAKTIFPNAAGVIDHVAGLVPF